ncbi:MAG: helix-turn-helix domain-containing protein [Oscillospiraceae bacterium]|nr:helix-turn-helix domain-containing protein [Oscillospiraceae bacterium]
MGATGPVAPIVERRQELGISQHELARLAGVHYQTVHRMEIGTQVPTWETRQKLRQVLGLPEERYITVQQRNEIFMELDRPIWCVINQNRRILTALHADLDDVYQDLALCAIRAIDRYDPTKSSASVKTFAMKNVEVHIKRSFAYFRCRGLSGAAARNLESGVVVSLDFMLEAGLQFAV